jgi:hypothetical protein
MTNSIAVSNQVSQGNKPSARVENILIEYKGKKVKGKELTVCSEIPMEINKVWANVKTTSLLQFVALGMITFKPVGEFPKQWEVGQTYRVKMRIFGLIPFGGIHYLLVEKIDDAHFSIATKEWDQGAKVWNHDIILKDLGGGKTYYEDSIAIYAGILTGLITAFAKRFYKHRQKRWQIVAKENLNFAK